MLATLLHLQARNLLHMGYDDVLFSILVFVILVSVYHATYNRYLHPLHKFPGPFWASVTDFYNTHLFATRRGHEELLGLHEKYG